MTSYSSLRSSLLGGVAATLLIALGASHAQAQSVDGLAPSIEIHPDVIESLRRTAMPAPSDVPAPQAPVYAAPTGRQPVNAPDAVQRASAPAPAAEPAPMRTEVIRQKLPEPAAEVKKPEPKKAEPKPAKKKAEAPAPVVDAAPMHPPILPNTDLLPPPNQEVIAPAPVVAPEAPPLPVETPQDKAQKIWGQFPQPGSKPAAPAKIEVPTVEKVAPPAAIAPQPSASSDLPPLLPNETTPPPMATLPALPEPDAAPSKKSEKPAKAEKGKKSAPILPPKNTASPAPAAPVELPGLAPMPALPEATSEPMAAALPPIPEKPAATENPVALPPAAPVPAPIPAAEPAPVALPPVSEAPPIPAAPAAPSKVATGEAPGLMDDMKRMMRKMIGKEPEAMQVPMAQPVPAPATPVVPEEKMAAPPSLSPALEMPGSTSDKGADKGKIIAPQIAAAPVVPAPVEVQKVAPTVPSALQGIVPTTKPTPKAAAKPPVKVVKPVTQADAIPEPAQSEEGHAPLTPPPLPMDEKTVPLAPAPEAVMPPVPAELEPMPAPPKPAEEKAPDAKAPEPTKAPEALTDLPPLPPEPAAAPAPKVEEKAAPVPPAPIVPAPAPVETPKAEPKPDPLAGLPPISMLNDDSKATKAAPVAPMMDLPSENDLPPLPETGAKKTTKKADDKAAKAAFKKEKPSGKTVQATPVPVVGGADLPPILELPPLPAEGADATSVNTPAPIPSAKLEVVEKDGKKVAPDAAKQAEQMASLPPLPSLPEESAAPAKESKSVASADAKGSASTKLVFKKDAMDIPAESEAQIQAFAKEAAKHTGQRIVIGSYASGKGVEQGATARKIALKRGLSVRSYLIDQGVDALRINVATKMDEGDNSPDRVELSLQ